MRSGLRKRVEFQRVYTGGVKCSGDFLVIFALPSEARQSRLGITATRRVGGAVVRNRARRRVRELFRCHPEALSGLVVDLVVNIRRSCSQSLWPDLERDYLRCVSGVQRRLAARASFSQR